MAVHSSLCSLIRTKKKLAYYGVFDEHLCESSGSVCGINGVTYNSECEALSGKFNLFGTGLITKAILPARFLNG